MAFIRSSDGPGRAVRCEVYSIGEAVEDPGVSPQNKRQIQLLHPFIAVGHQLALMLDYLSRGTRELPRLDLKVSASQGSPGLQA